MSAVDKHLIQIPVSEELRLQFEQGARDLHLTSEAYLAYLMERAAPGADAAKLDRHVSDVFGKHGELIRRLAK